MIGNAPAAETSGGMGVGPGDIRRYLFIMGSEDFLSCRGQLVTYSRHCRSRWLHNGAGNLQSVAFSFWARSAADGPTGLDDLDGVSGVQGIPLVVDQLLPKGDLLSGPAQPGQRTQGLLARGSGSLVYGGDGAPLAGLDYAEGE